MAGASASSSGLAVGRRFPVQNSMWWGGFGGQLPPGLDLHLPEGVLRRDWEAARLAAGLPITELPLLQAVGHAQLGLWQVAEAVDQVQQLPAIGLAELREARSGEALFSALQSVYARFSGVSGMQPKVLVRALASGGTPGPATHLVKAHARERLPGLAINEFLCLRAARAAGLPTPAAELLADGQLLLVTRFDLTDAGQPLGYDDACSLAGLRSDDKGSGSYEQVATLLREHLCEDVAGVSSLESFFRQMVLHVAVRNGDAHRKNVGVLYRHSGGPAWLAPAFDVVTTSAYIARDGLALTLEGSNRWPTAGRLLRFGARHCGVDPRRGRAILLEVADAVAFTARDLPAAFAPDPTAAATANRMLAAWHAGVAALRAVPE